MLHYIVKGGWVMIPIGLVSVIALAIVIEKWMCFSRFRKIPAGFLPTVFDALRKNKLEDAQAACQHAQHPIARIFEAGFSELGREISDWRAIEDAMRLKGEQTIQRAEATLKILSSLTTVLPLLGFLGTIVGLIISFQKWEALGPAVTIGELSGGMYQAMITTATGLILAIPYYLLYSYLAAKLESIEIEWSQYATEFLSRLRQAALQADAGTESFPFGGREREKIRLAK